MAANRQAQVATDAYRARLVALRGRSTAYLRGHWRRQLRAADLDASFAAWLAVAIAGLTAAQRAAIALSAGYLAAYLSAALARPEPPAPIAEGDRVGRTTDGRSLAQALRPALVTVKVALAQREAADVALRRGINQATRTGASEVLDTARDALAGAMSADERVIAWHRVVSAGACGACLALAGRRYETSRRVERHPYCRCTQQPVIDGVPDRIAVPTGTQIFHALPPAAQDRLFAGRGGAGKAALLRDGDITLEQLVSRSPQATRPDFITETPLAALTKR